MTKTLATKMQNLGNSLIKEAEHKYTESQSDSIRKVVERLVKNREDCKVVAIRNGLMLEFIEKQLKAIKTGQFSFHSWKPEIIFHDSKLNDPMGWEKD